MVNTSEKPIEMVHVWEANFPLRKPYDLSFGTVTSFRTLVVRIGDDSTCAWGESTPLPGYSDETADVVWGYLSQMGPALVGLRPVDAMARVRASGPGGFLSVALCTALEQLMPCDLPEAQGGWATAGSKVPLLGTIDSSSVDAAVRSASVATAAGYRTLKIKVALPPVDPSHDAQLCCEVRRTVGAGIGLRTDANQGYTFEQARTFLMHVQPAGLELLEQPLPPDDWDGMLQLQSWKGNVPLMLDESICNAADVERCLATRCADIVKLKLMKQGCLRATLDLGRQALAGGLGLVVGNGVQTDLGCMQEAWLHDRLCPSSAGEENGFLKMQRGLLKTSVTFSDGVLTTGLAEVDENVLDAHAVRRETNGRQAR